MRIVVTGGAGFIGSHLCEKLLEDGHEILCLDNFISGSYKNIEAMEKNSRFRFIQHDVTTPLTQDLGKIDQIYHLACADSPQDCKEIPLQILWSNAQGTKLMLELAFRQNAAFLLASSAGIYGNALENPQTENYFGNVDPVGEQSCSTEGKRFAESLVINYYRHYRFPLKIARIFPTYGPRMRKHNGSVMTNFINTALSGEPLRIHGDGNQIRTFCFIDDMIEGLVKLMNHGNFMGPVNLGNAVSWTILKLAQKIIDLSKSTSIISHLPGLKEDPFSIQPDVSLALKELNFVAKVSLNEGLKKTLSFFQ